jgi:hypothetical protein
MVVQMFRRPLYRGENEICIASLESNAKTDWLRAGRNRIKNSKMLCGVRTSRHAAGGVSATDVFAGTRPYLAPGCAAFVDHHMFTIVLSCASSEPGIPSLLLEFCNHSESEGKLRASGSLARRHTTTVNNACLSTT